MMLMKRGDRKSKEQIQAEELARLNTVEVKSVRARERDYAEARTRLGLDDAPPARPDRLKLKVASKGTPAVPSGPAGPAGPGRGFQGRGRGKSPK